MFKEWHKTKSINVFGYIDNFYTENNNLRISGWLVPSVEKDNVEFYLQLDDKLLSLFCFNERLDVAKNYNTKDNKFISCGFDVSIPKPKNDEIKLVVKLFNNVEDVFLLNVNTDYSRLLSDTSIQEYEEIKITSQAFPNIIVVDDFYEDPDLVRRVALEQEFIADIRYFKGKRTAKKFLPPGTKQIFEQLLGKKIIAWEEHDCNGVFQYCTAQDSLVIHSDLQSYAAVIYLTPNAPPETGTSFYRSKKHTNVRSIHSNDSLYNDVYENDYYDRTRFDEIDTVGNVYNRLVIWNARMIHSASEYFGNSLENSRLFHIFFFDTE